MADILRELYHGTVYPAEQLEVKTESFIQAGIAYDEAMQKFKNSLTAEQSTEHERLECLRNDYEQEYDFLNFRKGFQLGMQLTAAGLDKALTKDSKI